MGEERITAALIQEAVRVQRDKTLLEVRDLIDSTAAQEYDRRSYSNKPRSAVQFKQDVLAGLRALGERE